MKTFRLLSVLVALHFGVSLAASQTVSVSELNYNDPEGSDFEFIELVNAGAIPVSLTGAHFTSAVDYTFTGATALAGGERIVVVKNPAKFTARYGAGIRLAPGTFAGKFSDAGEAVTLVDAAGQVLFDFAYGPDGQWPSRPNGLGSSLECIDPAGDLSDPGNWRASAEWLGSPGRVGVGPQRVVVLNEILAHTDPPLEDAVELLNLTDQPVNVGGWYLSNNRAAPKKYRLPNNTVIAAHARLVIYEYQFKALNDPNAFTFNSAHGDDAVLMSADAAGNLKLWMDTVTFGATANGIGLGRYPDGTGKFTTLSRLTFGTDVTADYPPDFLTKFRTGTGASNAAPLVGPIVFSRIQYQPVIGGDEFLELQNNTADTVPLYDPLNPGNTWQLRDAVDFDFPAGVALAAGGRLLVVGIDPAVFRTKYGVPTAVPVLGPWTNALSNSGERVALFKPDPPQLPPHPDAGFVPYVLVEEVDYLPTAPWPAGAAGTGSALRRKDAALFGNDPGNWDVDFTGPPAVPILTVQLQATGVRLSFRAEAGRSYRLEGNGTVAGSPWQNLGALDAPAAGGDVSVDVATLGLARFFRVVAE